MFGIFKKKDKPPYISAVIAAGGSSSRMQGENKLLAEIGGLPVLAHTLLAFESNSNISEIVISAKEDMLLTYADIAKTFDISKATHVIAGGSTRAESVYKGVCAANPKADYILVHDAARPLISDDVINRVINGMKDHGCAAAAVAVKDTLRIFEASENGYRILPRDDVKAMQTPQGADRHLLAAALQNCVVNNISVTDDCAALELLGAKPFFVEGSYKNIKITTNEDLVIAEAFLMEEI
ncbi:MAG: 2-C-methyl-D-erythritol 4-phosphate cytidylyltransferase [Clostridiaceae bacterium]|nr:2-C-methyl-D-erythritol 4-phosphate cytidylyltransferase [Clostridiaceae bacterium]